MSEYIDKKDLLSKLRYLKLIRYPQPLVHIDDVISSIEHFKTQPQDAFHSSCGTKPEDIPSPLPDSGERRDFGTGAIRDIQKGKGRCDLMPLGVISNWMRDNVFDNIYGFQNGGDASFLYQALTCFTDGTDEAGQANTILEVSKHFEDGAQKYGENNWQKGIPVKSYIDSAVRHYLKFLRGDKDEPHDRAFVWNILCCIWTCKNKPELNDYAKKNKEQVLHNSQQPHS